MAKTYSNSHMFLLPSTSEYKGCFFFQNSDFVNENDDCYEITNSDRFLIKVYRKGENGATSNVAIQEVNKAYRVHESLLNSKWEIEKLEGENVLLSVDTGLDGEYYLLTQKANVKGEYEHGAKVMINDVTDNDILSNSYAESDFYLNLRQSRFDVDFSEQEEKAYLAYVEDVKNRVNNDLVGEQWFDYCMLRDEWAENKKAETAKHKISSYVNDKMDENNIPYALRNRKQFIVWKWAYDKKGERAVKLPMNPYYLGKMAKSDDAYTWATFDKCCDVVNQYGEKFGFAGVGIMFGNGVMGIDFDHCFKDGKLNDDVKDIVYKIGSYTELSPSGDGLHVLCFGQVPEGYGNRNDANGVECYDNRRFFTLTGNTLDNSLKKMRKKVDTEDALKELAERFLKPKNELLRAKTENDGEKVVRQSGALKMEDEEVIRIIRKGNRAKAFESLFDKGEVPEKADGLLNLQCMKLKQWGTVKPDVLTTNDEISKLYEKDNSSCDAYLCGILAGYTDSPEQMDRIFRQSALMRPNWDSRRGSSTYGENLCQTALNKATWKYKGNRLYSFKKGQMSIKLNAIEEVEE